MNNINDFIGILINNREKIAEKILQRYDYQYLLNLFDGIDESNNNVNIEPNNKYSYRFLTGKYNKSIYDKSCINWIPSKELVNGIKSIISTFNIKYVEEMYAGLGILSNILNHECHNIKIIASDPFDNPVTCNQLGLFPIAKRSPTDFKYYEKLKQELPEMIIISHYPSNGELVSNSGFIEEISCLIQSGKHSIIMMILPNTFTIIYDTLYHLLLDGTYQLYTYHAKVIDKYFYLNRLMKNIYPSGMLVHILVKINFSTDKNMENILGEAIIKTNMIDRHCGETKIFKIFYENFHPKLTKNILKSCDFKKPIKLNASFEVVNQLTYLTTIGVKTPEYIYDIDEFKLWYTCIKNKLFFVFENRIQFFYFFTQIKLLDNFSNRQTLDLPEWVIDHLGRCYIYTYFRVMDINNPSSWKNNYNSFVNLWNTINKKNHSKLTS